MITNVDFPDVLVYGSQENQQGTFLDPVKVSNDAKFTDVTIPLTGKIGSSVYLDVQSCNAAWNDTATAEKLFDEVIQQKTLTYKSATPTCGIVTLAKQPKYAEATKTDTPITIDGDIDAAWADANTIDVNTYSMGNGATAVSKMLWDENYLYVLTEVTDPVLSVASANAYEQDTVEVFFDENNHKSTSYETDDIQCRVNYENEKTVTDGRSTDAFLSGAKKTATGYIVEVAIPHTIDAFHSNQIVGFDVQVNDDGTGDSKRTSIANWNDLSGMGYTDPSGFGVLKLIGTDTPVVTTTTTGATGTTTTTTTTRILPPGSVLYGDVNLDNGVTLADLITYQKYRRGAIELNPQQQLNANVDLQNAELDDQDTVMLLKFLIGSINSLPIE